MDFFLPSEKKAETGKENGNESGKENESGKGNGNGKENVSGNENGRRIRRGTVKKMKKMPMNAEN